MWTVRLIHLHKLSLERGMVHSALLLFLVRNSGLHFLDGDIGKSHVKQEMARVNVNIPGISELKWTGMGEFNSNYHYIYYCRQGSLRRNGVAIIVNKSPKCSTWMQSQKRQNDLCSFPRQTIQYHSNPSLYPNQ